MPGIMKRGTSHYPDLKTMGLDELLQLSRELSIEIRKKLGNEPKNERICPKCLSLNVKENGSHFRRNARHKRYYCKDCQSSFNDYSNSFTYRSKFPEKWPEFLDILGKPGLTVKDKAKKLKISLKTYYRWKKKLYRFLDLSEPATTTSKNVTPN